MQASFDFSGSVVLVTGGARGVGRGITDGFLATGATVVVCGRKEPEPGQLGAAFFVECDVRDPEQVSSLVDTIVGRHGRLDVAVNNAGGSPPADSASASARFSESIIRLNLLAPLYVAQAAYRVMRDQSGGGVIINISSVSGMRPTPQTAAYGAAKAGLLNLTQTLAMEWAPNVRVNAVTAGLVKTDQSHLFYGDEEGIARVDASVPMGRMADPRDVGDACVFLASPAARYISGSNLLLHGGGEPPPYIGAAAGQ